MDRITLLQQILHAIYPFPFLHIKVYLPPQVDDNIRERERERERWISKRACILAKR
jgi:hypothetical protein